MTKRKEKKPNKKTGVGAKPSSSTAAVQSENVASSESSIDSVFSPSEFELIAKRNFPGPDESTIRSSELQKRIEKRKRKYRRKKLQAQAIQAECDREHEDDSNSANSCQVDKNQKAVKNNSSPASCVSQKGNLRAPKPKKKKRDEFSVTILGTSNVQNSAPGNLKNGSKEDDVNNDSNKRKAVPVGGREKKLGKKRKIADIFEEAEFCLEEAVPKKIDEVRKLLTKKTKVVAERKEKGVPKKKRDYEDLSFKKSRVEVDTELLETTGEGISSGLAGAQKILDKVDAAALPKNAKPPGQKTKLPDIDPNKFIPVKTQKLRTAVPEFEEGGDSESDEDEEQEQQRMNLMEAFADDDIADEFRKEKEEAEEASKPKTVDLGLPGWGSWGGLGIEPKTNRRRNKNVLKFPGVPRKDQGKKRVIIHDEPPSSFRKQQVNDLPPEFPSVAAYEASIRAPIGPNWVPQLAHKALVAAPVVTKMGAIIRPLDESHLVKQKAEEEALKKLNDSIQPGRPARKQKPPVRVKHEQEKPTVIWDDQRSTQLAESIRKERIAQKQKK